MTNTPEISPEECIEWLNDMLSCEDGTSGEFFYMLTAIRAKLQAAQGMAEALEALRCAYISRNRLFESCLAG
jgi:hypothetical protein